MAENSNQQQIEPDIHSRSRLARFEINGLFSRPINYTINFPTQANLKGEPSILILAGPNGSGKTTILKMIDGMLRMDFDTFRRVPFQSASLIMTTGEVLRVEPTEKKAFPLLVTFNDISAQLARHKDAPYPAQAETAREVLRAAALKVLGGISFSLLDIHRSLALKNTDREETQTFIDPMGKPRTVRTKVQSQNLLSQRVSEFVQEAQLDYRKFFEAEQLELLPRILRSLIAKHEVTKSTLLESVQEIITGSPALSRFGLATDDTDLETLAGLLSETDSFTDSASLAVFEAYVEMAKNRDQTKRLIAHRLSNFEEIMGNFLAGKSVHVDAKYGLKIKDADTPLNETDLSSGEYHFLYMMVTALLCRRAGSIIAIDEPEMSLHVTWQRKVVSALTKCAAGASPLFLFATHSAAIAAAHESQVQVVGVPE